MKKRQIDKSNLRHKIISRDLRVERGIIMKILKNKTIWGFVGGFFAAKVLKTKCVHEVAVKGVAEGMKLTRSLQASIQNIKEDAEDLCLDEATDLEDK